MSQPLKTPFPYFGGKSRVADLVWARLGDVDNFLEPFFGSGAVLLRRPHATTVESVNDINAYVANFWRAVQSAPEKVVEHADWPVSEIDMHARHRFLVLSTEAAEFRDRMRQEPDYFDARIAGWWCWGICCWIGDGWCDVSQLREDGLPREKLPNPEDRSLLIHPPAEGSANWQQRPQLEDTGGRGVLGASRPQLADAYDIGRGVNASLPQKRPMIASHENNPGGSGVHSAHFLGTCQERRAWLLDWFGRLQDRLRNVRVCCGHWLRICDSDSVTTRLGSTGLFLDPPYPTHAADGTESRCGGLYGGSDGDSDALDKLRDEVLAYCRERGPDARFRIAVCGYDSDGYALLEKEGWQVVAWKTGGGYGNRTKKGKTNAGRERIWFSPGCACAKQPLLFADPEAS